MTALDDYRLLGRSGLRVSPICLGTMTFGTDWGFGCNEDESKKIFDAYYNKGGNFFDTAVNYTNGTSESFLGKFVQDKRSDVVVATKYTLQRDAGALWTNKISRAYPNAGGNHRKNLVESLDTSLKRMGLDYIDLLYLHVWEYRTPVEEVVRALDDVVRSGKVLYVAISDTPAWVISQANTLADLRGWSRFIALQTRWNLLDRSFEFELGPMASELGLGTVPWGTLAEGFLTGKHTRESLSKDSGRGETVSKHASKQKNWEILDEVTKVAAEIKRTPAQVALNWMLAKGATSPLVGAKNVEQLEETIKSLEFKLTAEQVERLDKVSLPSEIPFPSSFGPLVGKYLDAGVKISPSFTEHSSTFFK
eukprot:TRINITY_DN1087_c0_g2_i2.p1 TRINITY_DN1087_c0_g2~~TRINITY_DN1087_c0_g2_i2.p1  ORF type:complete len:364 (-),score=77.70 TRINITY_DN1087_c0_g2_i2:90-1181(-)